MDNKLHDALQTVITLMRDIHGVEYIWEFQKYEDPLLYKVTFNGPQQRKIVIEVLENGNVSVLQTRDVLYCQLSIMMNKLMECLA